MSRDADTPSAHAAAPPAEDAAQMREMRLQRNLKIVVGVLGLMILAGLATVVGRIIYLASHGAKPTAMAAATPVKAGAALEIPLELPKGARVVSVSISGNRLAVHHESAWGTGIAIIDTDTGQHIANVRPQEATPGQ